VDDSTLRYVPLRLRFTSDQKLSMVFVWTRPSTYFSARSMVWWVKRTPSPL
jgi:hypothetical protein